MRVLLEWRVEVEQPCSLHRRARGHFIRLFEPADCARWLFLRRHFGTAAPSTTKPNLEREHTNQAGLSGILATNAILPSTRSRNPRDARFGDGQYLTDIMPGSKRPGQLSRIFLGHPFAGKRFSHRVDLNTSGMNVVFGRPHVYVIPNSKPLDISGRIVGHGPS